MINQQVFLDDLLHHRAVDFQPIHPRYFNVVLLRCVSFFLVALGIIIAIGVGNEWRVQTYVYVVSGLVLACFIGMLLLKLSFKYRGIAVRTHDVVFRNSLINITETIIPYNRVQHVKIKRGVFEKWYGLSEIVLFTAAGNLHNLKLPGLTNEQAEQIKSFIIERISVDTTNIAPEDVGVQAQDDSLESDTASNNLETDTTTNSEHDHKQ